MEGRRAFSCASPSEVYNEIDPDVVNLFRVVREHSARLTRSLQWTPFSREEYRQSFVHTDDAFESARRLVIRSYMGFGSDSILLSRQSGFRANAIRSGTTPAHDWMNFPPTLRVVARRLRGVTLENRPALKVIQQQDDCQTLFYADPPYLRSTRKLKGSEHCYKFEMTEGDHEELAEALNSVKGMVVLSGYHSKLYDRIYKGWETEESEALGDGACKRNEVLWFNRAATEALRAGRRQFDLFAS